MARAKSPSLDTSTLEHRICFQFHSSPFLDYLPVDNLIAPIFEERYGYRK